MKTEVEINERINTLQECLKYALDNGTPTTIVKQIKAEIFGLKWVLGVYG
jgi:hypothetical protein